MRGKRGMHCRYTRRNKGLLLTRRIQCGMLCHMPPIIVSTQFKGGVGKSTLALHLSSALGAVLVDAEPWGSATTWWAGASAGAIWGNDGPSPLLRALERGVPPRPRRGEGGRPPLVPSHQQLLRLSDGVQGGVAAWAWDGSGVPTVIIRTSDGVRPLAAALAEALPIWAALWNTPVVVDTPGGMSPLTDGAIAAADCLVVPVTLDPWSFPALGKFLTLYASRTRRGVVIPNRTTGVAKEDRYVDVLGLREFIPAPFVLGPPISESSVLRFATRPLSSGPTPGRARAAVVDQIQAVARFIMDVVATPSKSAQGA